MLETTRFISRSTPVFVETPPAPAGLNAAVRSLFGRLSAEPAPEPVAAVMPRKLPPVWETRRGNRPSLSEFDVDAGVDPEPSPAPRAAAQAAARIVGGTGRSPLDAALEVFEAEIARLRRTVLTYGEALKAIEVYGADPEVRKAAADALRRAPERLRTAEPVPHEPKASAVGHG